MSLLLFNWIERDLQLPLDRDHFERHFRSGYNIGQVALKAGMHFSDGDAASEPQFVAGEEISVIEGNFRSLRILLTQNGVDLKSGSMASISKGERGAAASLLLLLLDWSKKRGTRRSPRAGLSDSVVSRFQNPPLPLTQRVLPEAFLFSKRDILSTVRDGFRDVERQVRALGISYLERRQRQEAEGFSSLESLRAAHQTMLSTLRETQLSKDREAKQYQKEWNAKGIRSWKETRKHMTRLEAADLRVELSLLEKRKKEAENNRHQNAMDTTSSIADYERNYRQLGINANDIKDREVTLKTQPPSEEKPYDQFKRLSGFVSTVSFERPMKLYQTGIRRRRQQTVLDKREKTVRLRRQLVAQKRTQEQLDEEKREEGLLLSVQSAYEKEVEESLRFRQREDEKRSIRDESFARSAESEKSRQEEAETLMKQFAEHAAREREELSSQVSQVILNEQLEQENRRRVGPVVCFLSPQLKHEDAIRFIRFIPHACADIAMLVSDYKQNNRPKVPPLVWREWKEQLVHGVPFFENSYSGDPMHQRNWELELWSQYDYTNFHRPSEMDSFLLPVPGRMMLPLMGETPQVWKRLLSPWPSKPPPPRPTVALGLVVWGAPLSGKSACLRALAQRLYMEFFSVEMVLEELVSLSLSTTPEQMTPLGSRFTTEQYRSSMDALLKVYAKLSPAKAGGASKKQGNPMEVLEKLRKEAALARVLAAMVNQLSEEQGSVGWILEWNLSMDLWLPFSYLTSSPAFVAALGKGAETEDLFVKKLKGKKFDFPSLQLPVPVSADSADPTAFGMTVWNDSFHSYGVVCYGQDAVDSPELSAFATSLTVNPLTGSVITAHAGTPTEAAPPDPKDPSKTPELASGGVASVVAYPLSSRRSEFESMLTSSMGQAYFQAYPPAFSYPERTPMDRVLSDLLTVYRRAGWEGKHPEPSFDQSTEEGRVDSEVYWYQRHAWESGEAAAATGEEGGDGPLQYGVEPYIQELMINYERIEMDTEDQMKEILMKLYQADRLREDELAKESGAILETLRGPLGGTKRSDSDAQCDELWMDAYRRIEETKRLVCEQRCSWVGGVAERFVTGYNALLDGEAQYWGQWIRLFSVLQFNQQKSFSLESLMQLLPDFQSRMDSLQQQLSPSPTSDHAMECLTQLYQDLYQLLQELKEEERQKKIEKYEREQREAREQRLMEGECKLSSEMEVEYRREQKVKSPSPPPPAPVAASKGRKTSANRPKSKGKTPPQTGKKPPSSESAPLAPSASSEPVVPEPAAAEEKKPQDAMPAEDYDETKKMSTMLLEMYYHGMESIVRLSQHADHRMDGLLESQKWLQSMSNLWIEGRVRSESHRVDAVRSLPTGSPLPPYDFTDPGTRQGLKPVIQSLIPEADVLLKWCRLCGPWDRSLTEWDCQGVFHEGVKARLLSPDWLSLLDDASFLRMGKSLNRSGTPENIFFSMKDVVLDLLETKYGIPETKYILKLYTSLSCKDRQGNGAVSVRDLSKEFLWFPETESHISDFWRLLSFVFSSSSSGSEASVPFLDVVFQLCCRETRACPPQRHTGCYAAALVASKMFNLAPGCVSYASLREMVLREPGHRPEHIVDSIWEDLHESSDAIVSFFSLCQSRNYQLLVENGFYRFTDSLQL